MSSQTGQIILENETLRWSSPSIFNDLEECQLFPYKKEASGTAHETYMKLLYQCAQGRLIFNLNAFSEQTHLMIAVIKTGIESGKLDESTIDSIVKHTIDVQFSNPEEEHRNYINNAILNCCRVLCLTTDYNNQLMWAHYADEHRGCVFEFEEPHSVGLRNLKKGVVQYVEYESPSVNPVDLLLFGEKSSINYQLNRDIFFTKRDVWAYENEYRLMFSETFGEITIKIDMQKNTREMTVKGQKSTLHTDVPYSPKMIKSITFGARTKNDIVLDIKDKALNKNQSCKFFQMSLEGGKMVRKEIG